MKYYGKKKSWKNGYRVWYYQRLINKYLRTCDTLIDIGAVGILTCHIKKPSTNGLWEAGDVYDLKGATEYVDASTSVLLLERTRQGRSNDGRGFGKVDKDKVTLHFAKTRIALRDLEPLELQRNFDRGSFDVIT